MAIERGASARYSPPDWPFTHLGGKVLPTHGVFRAVGVIAVPPVQVQLLRPVLVGLEALDVHVRVQVQSHCEERRSSLQSPGQLNPGQTNPAREQAGRQAGSPHTGPRGCRNEAQTRAIMPAGRTPGLFPPGHLQWHQHLPGPPWKASTLRQ